MTRHIAVTILCAGVLLGASTAHPLDSAFSYQGRLNDGGVPAVGQYDLRFILYDAEAGGSQVGPTLEAGDIDVADGYFSAYLDFGPDIFTGIDLWLEVSVRPGASNSSYTALSPRQPILPSPYSLHAGEVMWDDIADVPAGFADGIDNESPTGAVMFFDLASCPAGWSPLESAQGRVIVGMGAGGTLGATVGDPLDDQEERSHTHVVDPPSMSSGGGGSHTHAVDPPPSGTASVSHSHTVDVPAFQSPFNGEHNHQWAIWSNKIWRSFDLNGDLFQIINWNDGMDTAGSGNYPLAMGTTISHNWYTGRAGSHSHFLDPPAAGTTSNSHSHSFDMGSFATASEANHVHVVNIAALSSTTDSARTPYLQLLVCRKN